MPDAFRFNTCIDAYSRSSPPDAAQQVTRVYEQMVELHQQSGRTIFSSQI
jgi:hypothetical protein